MPSRIYNLAARCPTCGAGKDQPCTEVVGQRRLPPVRRTHKARADSVRAMGNPKVIPRRSTLRFARTGYLTQAATAINVATTQYVTAMNNFTNAVATTTGTWTVTRDEMWQAWVAVNNTTTGNVIRYEYTDQQAAVWANWDRDYQQITQVLTNQRQAEREAESRRRLARQQVLAGARERALELFTSLLSAEQRVEWSQVHRVTVKGSEGGLYWIEGHRETVHGNIVQIDEHGCMLARLCVAPQMYTPDGVLPMPDGWVGQLLNIRHNEGELRRTANFSNQQACRHPGIPVLGTAAA